MQTRIILLVAAVLIIGLTVRTCTKENYPSTVEPDSILQYKYEIVQDTIITLEVDTVFVTIEQRVEQAITSTEAYVQEIIDEMDVMEVQMVKVATLEERIVYDTVQVEVLPDSVMIYNVFEYYSIEGDEITINRDTIQSRKVSRQYIQKYIIQ